MMDDPQVTGLGEALVARGWMLSCAESCTGGGIAARATSVAGSSAWFDRGFVTYSNESKQEMLGVDGNIIAAHGAVSEQTVLAMVEGALARSRAQVAVAVSGIAGPGGGSATKPVGTVWLAWQIAGRPAVARCFHFDGDRNTVRCQAENAALDGLLSLLSSP